MARVIIFLFLVPLFISGAIFLQIFLSKTESRWPGLILPLITFGYSLMMVLSLALFTVQTSMQAVTENGEVIAQIIQDAPADTAHIWALIPAVIIPFLLCNIPTAILLLIYFSVREKKKHNSLIEKMRAQDLE